MSGAIPVEGKGWRKKRKGIGIHPS